MKHLILAAILIPATLIAQQSPLRIPVVQGQPGEQTQATLPDNYQVTLTISDKDGQPTEVSVVVASTQFKASLEEQRLTISGTVTVEESGGVIVAYVLGWETPITVGTNTEYKTSSTQGSVRLKLGEEVQIIRAGTRTARLTIKKLEVSKPK